jgi:urease accessory protein
MSIERVTSHARAGDWSVDRAADSVTLDFDHRHRRRLRLRSDSGADFLLDLPKATMLGEGDGLRSTDGYWLCVHAANEPVLEITASSPILLTKLAWHIGNRHIPAQIDVDRILIRRDHVLQHMIEGLGGTTRQLDAPFQPEAGAYAEREHGHDHQ